VTEEIPASFHICRERPQSALPECGATGPQPISADHGNAAPQLHQTGHSCIAQHFPRPSVGYADLPDIRRGCSISAATAKNIARLGKDPTCGKAA